MSAAKLMRLAHHENCIAVKDGRGIEQRAMMLAAVKTVAQADTVGLTRGRQTHVTAKATSLSPMYVSASTLIHNGHNSALR